MRGLSLHLLSLAAAIITPFAHASSTTRNPLGAISTIQNATIHTHNHRLTALSEFDLTFSIQDELLVKFSLTPNHDIFAEDATISYLQPDGSISYKESVNRLGHKVYKGTAWIQRAEVGQDRWQPVGWARVTVSKDSKDPVFEGAFAINHDHHHIQSRYNYLRTKHRLDPEVDTDNERLIVWRDSDILPNVGLQQQGIRRDVPEEPFTCRSESLGFNLNPEHPVYQAMRKRSSGSLGYMDFTNLFKRQIDGTTSGNSGGVNLTTTIGDSAGCPSTRKVALVGVATDCTYTGAFNSTETARENVISQINTASAIWESTFNISLGLANLTLSNAECPSTPAQATQWNQGCSSGVDIQDRLNYFSAWRGTQQDNNSHWTLLSTCNTGSAVGLAWLGQACVNTAETLNTTSSSGGATSGTETVSGANVVIRTEGASEWQIIAHETGHTYGAVHDCTSTTCADANTVNSQQCCPLSATTCNANDQYIMNPSTGQGINKFSPCTIGNICSAIGKNSVSTSCLANNREVTTISGQQCGNGIVEAGEDCDCGGTEGCGDDPCCDPTTCKFTSGSVCDDSNEECCRNCQLATNGTVCRASTGDCDPQEVCTGTSGVCPPDQTAPNGQSCGDGLQCASGSCTSRDEQCKSVMGSYTQGNDTYACDSTTCTISCASPEFGTGVCYGLQQNFLDGTSCSGGGECQNGQCKGASVGGEVSSWIDDHKELVIGLAAGIGGLLVLAILSCCISRCRRRNRIRKQVPSPPVPPPGGWQGWNSGRPQMEQPSSSGWYNPNASRGGAGGAWATPAYPPPPPPPAYSTGGINRNMGSVRYA